MPQDKNAFLNKTANDSNDSNPTTNPSGSNSAPDTNGSTVESSTALERLSGSALAASDIVSQMIGAAQSQAQSQADAIAAYPALVDSLTRMYLEERGIDLGKPAPFRFEVKIPEMDEFNRLLEISGAAVRRVAAARQIAAAQTVRQLPEGS